jgi:hypothetical protein
MELFKQLTESSKVSKFSKEEFEAYQKVYHEKWDHNVMVKGVFEEFADEINAKVEERASKKVNEREREMAKAMREQGVADSIIAKVSGLSVEEIARL